MDRLVDVFFILDIFFNFFTGFTISGKMIMDPRRIASQYIRTWFALDVIASVPFDLLVTTDVESNRQAGSVPPATHPLIHSSHSFLFPFSSTHVLLVCSLVPGGMDRGSTDVRRTYTRDSHTMGAVRISAVARNGDARNFTVKQAT